MSYKTKWIEAYIQTMKEYETDTHQNDPSKCAKCILANSFTERRSLFRDNCCFCPESVFGDTDGDYGCLHRINHAQLSSRLSKEEKAGILLYHQRVIEHLKTLPAKVFVPSKFSRIKFEHLTDIDASI